MIDLKDLRDRPDHYRTGCKRKRVSVDIDRILQLDADKRRLGTQQQELRAEQRRIEKDLGPKLGQLSGQLKKAGDAERPALERQLAELRAVPAELKARIAHIDQQLAELEPSLAALLLAVPQPPDRDVPDGDGSEHNIELSRWSPSGFSIDTPFQQQRGFAPKNHLQLAADLGLVDFPRGVKLAGSRSYVLTGDGYRLHNAILRYALDFMTEKHGFVPVSVPVIVREEAMIGTGFFPAGREQAYHVEEQSRGEAHDLFLTGTGEVGLMGLHMDEIIDESKLPLRYTTVSTCFRREAGAAGKDTAGLYRIHQFDKVEQVVICKADEAMSRAWHRSMIGYVEELLRSLELPYRLLQCCTGDLGMKNADMVDIECWMPGRDDGKGGLGAFGETHSASRLYDYQCRRLNMRYRPGGESGQGQTVFCHSLNNTVAASPRILIPLLEVHQQADGSVRVPGPLQSYMGGRTKIAK